MRRPEHDCIQIVATDFQADAIERMFSPNFTLMLMPGVQGEDDLPTYFLALTERGVAATNR